MTRAVVLERDSALRLRVQLALYNARPGVVAARAGISPSTFSRILRGKQALSDTMLVRIEDAIRGGGRRG